MQKILISMLVAAVLLVPGITRAQGTEIKDVINDQVSAFQANDLSTAFSFASPAIRRIFGDPQRFGAMVEKSYPMVWRPAEMQFGGLKEVGQDFVQTVYFTDQAGRVFEAAYEMIRIDQSWKINGVMIRQADLGA